MTLPSAAAAASSSTPVRAPLFSIVIPTLEASTHVERALESLARQSCRDFEVLLVDGDSLDDTVALSETVRPRLPSLTLLVGADGGIYQGINRGVAAARGQWLLVLGSDDRLHDDEVLAQVAHRLEPELDLLYGDVLVQGSNAFLRHGERYIGRVDLEYLLDRNVCQQAIFYRRELLQRLGGFNPRYRVCADWAFLLRAWTRARVRWMDLVVADYSAHGMSSRTDDPAYDHDRPMLVRDTMLAAPRHPEVQRCRWRLRHKALQEWRKGRPIRALRLLAGWAWLMFTGLGHADTALLTAAVSAPRDTGAGAP